MAVLSVRFQSCTAREWAIEELVKLGLSKGKLNEDYQFLLVGDSLNIFVMVRVPDSGKLDYLRSIAMITRVTKVECLPLDLVDDDLDSLDARVPA